MLDAVRLAVPPTRADQVGSLLRPAALLAERERFNRGEISAETLRAAEDTAIRGVIATQESLGLQVVTDGEYRRGLYSDNFTETALTGVTMEEDASAWAFQGGGKKHSAAPLMRVVDRIRWSGLSHNAADFAFLKANTSRIAKITLPGPAFIHYRAGRGNISRDVYPDLDLFWSDLAEAYRQELEALHRAGCTYVQLDETSLAKFGDPKIQQGLAARGDDWRTLLHTYVDALNAVADAAPPGLLLAIHLCRGNNQGQWQAEGGYEAVAEVLFNKLRIPLLLLEFDTPRAGSLDVLKTLPEGKAVVLGLVSTKTGELESRELLLSRLREAATHASIEQLAISPQCGFASVEHGNPITPEQQAAKLRRCVEIAAEVWGSVAGGG
ncbi:5-methyltetrahydropteroyltriglutamate--homocysteine S-methyltransferase [Roseomonas sp. BN140053]|uniref:5-methyltetrahydropteroyltriglutamate-- homocysteine S-methyltransferase n=1 Tax=Roseomonas sp. BN140053 TaxID=3391898 RepID=UPI0039E853EA